MIKKRRGGRGGRGGGRRRNEEKERIERGIEGVYDFTGACATQVAIKLI